MNHWNISAGWQFAPSKCQTKPKHIRYDFVAAAVVAIKGFRATWSSCAAFSYKICSFVVYAHEIHYYWSYHLWCIHATISIITFYERRQRAGQFVYLFALRCLSNSKNEHTKMDNSTHSNKNDFLFRRCWQDSWMHISRDGFNIHKTRSLDG